MKNSNRRAKTAFAAAFLAALMIAGNVGLLAAPKKSAKVKSQTSSAAAAAVSADNPVVFQIGTEKFTYDDVNKVCLRNSSGKRSLKSMSCDSMKQFIELYYTYQLKLKDAESRGYEKDPAVKHELENNRKIVAENYFFDKFVATPNINKMVERRAEEKQISYMLFSFPACAGKRYYGYLPPGFFDAEEITDGRRFRRACKSIFRRQINSQKWRRFGRLGNERKNGQADGECDL